MTREEEYYSRMGIAPPISQQEYESRIASMTPQVVADPAYSPDIGAVISVLNSAITNFDAPPWLYEENFNAYISITGDTGGFPYPSVYAQRFSQTQTPEAGYSTTGISTAPLDASASIGAIIGVLDSAVASFDAPPWLYAQNFDAYYSIAGNNGGYPEPSQYEAAYNARMSGGQPAPPATGGAAKGLGLAAAAYALLAIFGRK